MKKDAVVLTAASNPYQQSIIAEILKEAGIPFYLQDGPGPTAILGSASPLGYQQFRVPPGHLQRAKEVLCANGIVCEVSDRLLNRCLDEIIKPLLFQKDGDLGRLLRFVELNNKETVRALFEATLRERGGRELLEDLFFLLALNRSAALRTLSRTLHQKLTKVDASFGERFQADAIHGSKKTRLALLEALPDLPASPHRVRALAAALRDQDGEIREAASEALFALGGDDYGYDPQDPPAEREVAVRRLLGAAGLS